MQTLSLPSANGLFRDLVVSNWEILLDGQPMLVEWAPIGRLKDGEFKMLSNFQKRVRWFLDKAKHYNAHIIIDEKTQILSDLEWAFKNKDTSTATTSILVMFQKLLGVEIKEAKVIASQAWTVQDEVAMVVAIEAVKDAFAKRFPNTKGIEWSKESETEFEAEFKAGGKEQSANFDQSGKWLVTETVIKKADLPQSVQTALTKEFAGYKVEEAEKVETANDGTQYEVALEKGELNYEVLFSADGKVLKKEEKKEKDDDKD